MTVVHGPVKIKLFKKKNVGIQMSIDEGVSSMDDDIACAGNLRVNDEEEGNGAGIDDITA